MSSQIEALQAICESLDRNEFVAASDIAQLDCPFEPMKAAIKRNYSDADAMRVFMRDGYVDRYSGDRLIFPGTLRLLSELLPKQFPYHKNWKMTHCHPIYWQRYPTIDHLTPVARGGSDSFDN